MHSSSSFPLSQLHKLHFWRVALAFYLYVIPLRAAADCPRPVSVPISNCTTQPHGVVNTSADTWGLLISVGSPPQELCVSPSTFTNHTFLPSSDLCTNDNYTVAACTSRRGGGVSISAPGSSFTPTDSLERIYALNPNWVEVDRAGKTVSGNVTLQTPPSISLSDFPVGIIAAGQRHNVGHLGLAESSVFLQRAVKAGYAPVEGFSFKAGSQSYVNPRAGDLVIGGYDSHAVASPFIHYSISSSVLGDRLCPLLVRIQRLELKRPGVASVELVSPGSEIPACIEPYDNLFRLPLSILETFILRTGARNDSSLESKDFLVVEPGLTFGGEAPFNGSLKFTLNNGFEVEIPNRELTWPRRGIAANGTRVLQPNVTEVAVHVDKAPLDTAVLGKVFLSSVYLAVSYREKQFSLARVAQDATTVNLVPFPCPAPRSKLGLGLGLGLGLPAALAFIWWACYKMCN